MSAQQTPGPVTWTLQVGGAASQSHKRYTQTWDEFLAWFAPAVIPVTGLSKTQVHAWIPGTFDGARRAADMIDVSIAVADVDGATEAQVFELYQRLAGRGLAFAMHTTYKHGLTCHVHHEGAHKRDPATPDECPPDCPERRQGKYRLAVALSRPVRPSEWLVWWPAFAGLCGGLVDPQTKDMSRIYFIPGRPARGPAGTSGRHQGAPLDVDALLIEAGHTPAPGGVKNGPVGVAGAAPTTAALDRLARKIMSAQHVQPERLSGAEALARILSGDDFAAQGERDNTLFHIGIILAETFPHTPPALIVEPLRAELVEQSKDETWHHGDAARELEAKIERKQAERGAKVSESDSVRLGQLGRTGPYTPDEVAVWCEAWGVTPLELRRQLLVHCRGSFWVFFQGAYEFAGASREAAELYIRHRLEPAQAAPLDVQLREITPKGVVSKSIARLLEDYSVSVRTVESSLVAQATSLDLVASRLTVATAPRDARLVPARSERADLALRMMTGADDSAQDALSGRGPATYARVLDWLATAPALERATAALYLHGAKRTGKSQLAAGLARVWGSRPTTLAECGAAFNERIARNPCILADESIPLDWRRDSGRLRALITGTDQPLRQKYQENQSLAGALRVVLAANNLRLLAGTGETLEQADIEAICERVLYVHTGQVPVPHVEAEEFAAHILWLHDTRGPGVAGDGRLWVSGVDSALHRQIRTSGRARALVCQWLVGMLEIPSPIASHKHLYHMSHAGGLCVAPRLLYAMWPAYLPDEQRLSLRDIANVLEEIGTAGSNSMIRIRLEDLAQWCATTHWGLTLEDLERKVGGV